MAVQPAPPVRGASADDRYGQPFPWATRAGSTAVPTDVAIRQCVRTKGISTNGKAVRLITYTHGRMSPERGAQGASQEGARQALLRLKRPKRPNNEASGTQRLRRQAVKTNNGHDQQQPNRTKGRRETREREREEHTRRTHATTRACTQLSLNASPFPFPGTCSPKCLQRSTNV